MVENFLLEGCVAQKTLLFSGISSSTWYNNRKKTVCIDGRKNNKGRPVPGFAINSDSQIIQDDQIVSILVDYRSRKEFINAGGYHKLVDYIRRDYGIIVNPKKLYRLCRENDLLLPKRRRKPRYQRRISQNRIVSRPNQLWEIDLKYGFIHGENRFFFILVILDVFSRLVINYHIGLRCLAKDLVFTLKHGIYRFNIDQDLLVIRTDRGTQMTSNLFLEYVNDQGEERLIHELIPPATPNKNAHIEAFNSILEIEFLQVWYFRTYGQAYEQTVDFMENYNHRGLHGSLENRTPYEIYEQYLRGDNPNIREVKL